MMIVSAPNIAVLLLYVAVSVVIARSNKFAVKSLEDYAIGYTSVSTSVLVCAILASALGAGSIVGNTNFIFTFGLPLVIIQLLYPLSWWFSSKIFPRNIAAMKTAGCLSISHVMQHVYGNKARWITTFLTLLTDIGIIAAQMLAICVVLNQLFLIPEGSAMIIALLMVMLFSLMGGIRTIAQTGMFQFLLFFLLFPISYLLISHQYGGFEGLSTIFPYAIW